MASKYLNPHVVDAVYAVRGLIPTRAAEIQSEIAKGSTKYPFPKMIFSNIGNPQALKAKPLTFNRQVMSLVDCPNHLDNAQLVAALPEDVVARARSALSHIGTATGAYTASAGYEFVRENVAEFITKRDRRNNAGLPAACPNDIMLTDGASNGVKFVLQVLIGGAKDSVMVPIPQYPLYTATISLLGGVPSMYYLDEGNGWAMSVEDLQKAYNDTKAAGSTPRILVVINPGNPTGTILSKDVMEGVVRFAHDNDLLLLADEVYQENVYVSDKAFHSFREVMLGMESKYATGTQLISLHSTSKGIIGECGRRGGYMELVNVAQSVREQIVKLTSISLCPNVNGQIMVDLMVAPPPPGSASHASYMAEYTSAFESLQLRAKHLKKELDSIKGLSCNDIEGAMYAFPQLKLPAAFIKYNDEKNAQEGRKLAADARWALDLLETTGIVVVPGSGFGQKEGTYHFRTTILPPMDEMQYLTEQLRAFQNNLFEKYGN